MNHNSVPSVCTASFITGWTIKDLNSKNEKDQVNIRLTKVKELIGQGFKRDFALIHAITTKRQDANDFLEKIGFKMVFEGTKTKERFDSKFSANSGNIQREQDSGNLYLWAITPKDYQEGLESYLKVLEARKEEIDPAKKPSPERLKFPDLRILDLRKAGMVVNNMHIDNAFKGCLLKDAEIVEKFIKLNFGIDIKAWCNDKRIDNWTTITGRQLKDFQQAWKNELL